MPQNYSTAMEYNHEPEKLEAAPATPSEENPRDGQTASNSRAQPEAESSTERDTADVHTVIDHESKTPKNSEKDPIHPVFHHCQLGDMLHRKYSTTGDVAFLDHAMSHLRQALDLADNTHNEAVCCWKLASLLNNRHANSNAAVDAKEAVQFAQKAVDLVPKDSPLWQRFRQTLVIILRNEYTRTRTIHYLDRTIQTLQEIVNGLPINHPNRPKFLSDLENCFYQRYLKQNNLKDLEEAIKFTKESIDVIPEHGSRADRFKTLANRLWQLYQRTGETMNLDGAIQAAREAICRLQDDHIKLIRCLDDLREQLIAKFEKEGSMSTLQEAIESVERIQSVLERDNPDWPKSLLNLGTLHYVKYTRTGDMADLDKSITITQQGIDAEPESSSDKAILLSNLGHRLGRRYARTGVIADLEEGIKVLREALSLASTDGLNLPMCYDNLAKGLEKRYRRTGAGADLEESISLSRKAVEITPRDDPQWRVCSYNLSDKLTTRFLKTRAIADFEEALRILLEIIDTTQEHDKHRPAYIQRLGFLWAFLAEDKVEFDTIPSEHDKEMMFFPNLKRLPKDLGFRSMLDLEPIQLMRRAVDGTPEDHPLRGDEYNDLGMQFILRYRLTQAESDIRNALSNYKLAFNHASLPAASRLEAGKNAIQIHAAFSEWDEAYEVSKTCLYLIQSLLSRSLDNSDKQVRLVKLRGLASDMAVAAINANAGSVVALNSLEQARGLLANSIEELRVDVEDLHQKYPKLGERFIYLRDALDISISLDSSVQQRYENSKEFDQVISEIREKPEFADFLLGSSEADMRRAAQYGPIIVINVNHYRCDAILIEERQIRLLPLPDLNYEQIEKNSSSSLRYSPDILSWLWDTIANPVLTALGFTQSPPHERWPHIWWVPTGPLSRYPLHASGYHLKRGCSEAVLDRVISSYGLSVKAIIRNYQRTKPTSTCTQVQALLVAMEDTPGYSPLSFTKKEVEVVYDLCKSMQLDPIIPENKREDIIKYLPTCKIFHFAGHGYTDVANPSKSQLLLEDWKSNPLTVSTLLDINTQQQKSPFLAYLSACGTGRSDNEGLVDEGIHLINACQLAGFRHVIGTLWEVNDKTCVDIARITYQGIKEGGMIDASVSQGLHNAIRQARDLWVKAKAIIDDERGDNGLRDYAAFSSGNSDRSARDVILCDDDLVELMHWVPYVHFGI